jgi:PhnB protein
LTGSLGLYVHLTVEGGERAISWYQSVFGATLKAKHMADDKERVLFAILEVFGGHVFVSESFAEYGSDTAAPSSERLPSCAVHIDFIDPNDVNGIVAKAEAAGAMVTMKPGDVYWGDRYARLRDPFGHVWSFGARGQPATQ